MTARYDLHALRRTPPTEAAPYAIGPAVLRLLYADCRRAGDEIAVVLIGGDKTSLGNLWYRRNTTEVEVRLDQYCRRHPDVTPIVMRGDR